MTQEEKARRYDEAIERAKKELNTCGSQDCDAARQIFRFFPELRESEDERIRKQLIEHIKWSYDEQEISEEEKERWISWLEKQGEQKHINLVTILDDYFANTPKEQQDKDWEELKHFNNFGLELVEQKPAWSEEDERKISDVIVALSEYANGNIPNILPTILLEDVDWLKSLRLQNRWKPSAFHLECIEDAIAIYEERGINAIGLKEILEELKKLKG